MKRPVQWSRDALDDIRDQVSFIAVDDPQASRRIADALRASADFLGDMAIGRRGRILGTFEKSVTGLPYIIAYTIDARSDAETIVILRVIHTSRDWTDEGWPAEG